MPISDPGAFSLRGFTFIELLVVLLIMGLFVGLASAIVRPDERVLLRVEAERLAQLLELAAAESRLTGNSIAWTADRSSYRFWRMPGDAEASSQSSEIRDSDLLRPRTLPQDMMISGLRVENLPAQGAMRLEFVSYHAAPSFSIEMSLGAARLAVVASPVGELQVLPREGEPSGGLALR